MAISSTLDRHMSKSKVIIAGSRDFHDFTYVQGYMATIPPWIGIDEVVCGEAKGADALGKRWAELHGIPVKSFHADWERLGKRAGPIRNAEMGIYADGLIAFWDGKSSGTAHMIKFMESEGKWTYVVRTDIPWNKEWRTTVHNGKTIKSPILNNTLYTAEYKRKPMELSDDFFKKVNGGVING